MGWQDAPEVGKGPKAAAPAWQSAPVVTQPAKSRSGAPPVPVTTRQQDVEALARKNLGKPASGFLGGLGEMASGALAGVERAAFGIPERVEAAARYYLPIQEGDAADNYRNTLELVRKENDLRMERAPVSGFVGNILGALGSGGVAANAVRAGGARVAASSAPKVAKGVGNFLQSAATLKKGQHVRNAAKIVAAGGAGGGAQAAGEDKNILEGAGYGAGGAGLIVGGGKLVKAGAKGVRNLAGFEPVDQILAKYVKTPMADLQQELQRRAAQGLPSTLYEVLPAADRQALDDAIGKMPDRQRARVTEAVRQRAQNIVQETADRAGAITRPTGPETLRSQVARDLAQSRNPNELPTPDDIAMAERAALDPTDMDLVKTTEARNIMAPHDPVRAASGVDDLIPKNPVLQKNGEVGEVSADPEAASILRTAAGRLALRDPEQGITIGEVTQLLSRLSKMGTSANKLEAANARNAAEHVMDFLEQNHPELNKEIARMRSQWRMRTNTIDAMLEGNQSRTRAAAGFAGKDPQDVRQLYDTPEGAAGRNLGQGARLQADILTSPEQSIGALNEIATNPTRQAAISANLGNDAGQNLAEVAQMQTQSARNLAPLLRDQAAEAGHDPVHILQNLMMLSPNTLPATKALALSRLVKGSTRIPAKQAETLVDMLFSQNPTQISQALGLLGKMGSVGQEFRNSVGAAAGAAMEASRPEGISEDQSLVGFGTNEDGSAYPQYGNVADTPAEDTETEQLLSDAAGPAEVATAGDIVQNIFPGIEITQVERDPNSPLGRANPDSWHNRSSQAVDVRPIPGMSFEEYVQGIRDAGYEIIEAIDEVNNPSGHATGPHWHVVIG